MSKYLHLLLLLSLVGCSTGGLFSVKTLPEKPVVERPTDTDEAEKHYPEGQLRPAREVDELLIQRLSLCNADTSDRDEVMAGLAVQASAVNGVDEERLNQLLLASCSPATKPGVLNQLLADLTSAGTWPEGYAAFFDLLISGQRAYAAVEKVYLDLKQEHEKTIQGLSEIETQIEKQSSAVQP